MREDYNRINGISLETGIATDYATAWTSVVERCLMRTQSMLPESEESLFPINAIQKYEEYILGRGRPGTYDVDTIKASNPEQVCLINDAVLEMNAQLPQLLTDKNYQAIIDFWEQRVRPLIYDKK